MTALQQDSFDTPAIGRQSNSQKETMPGYSFGTGSRETARLKVYISKQHQKSKGSMNSPGPVYANETCVGTGPKFGFGSDEQRKHSKAKYPDSSVDLTCSTVDSQGVKFHSAKSVHMGTETRMNNKNAEIVRVHPLAMMGVDSPGALEYHPDPSKVKKVEPEYSFGPKVPPVTTGKVMPRVAMLPISTPRAVGPGSNSLPAALGEQPVSKRMTAPAWSFGVKHKNSGDETARQHLDTSPNLSSLGRQVVSSARSAPECGFGSSTRDHAARTTQITTQADRGPVAHMPKPNFHLDLPAPSKLIAKPGM